MTHSSRRLRNGSLPPRSANAIPCYRHPMAQASGIVTIAPSRLMVGFGTSFTGRAGMGAYPRRDMPEAVPLTGGPPRVRQRHGLENDQQRDGLIAEAPASA